MTGQARADRDDAAGAPVPRGPYALHFFVCTDGPDCPVDGTAGDVCTVLKKEVKARGLQEQVRVNRSGCLGQCGHGPVMAVYPDNAWYVHLDVEKAMEVMEAHLQRRPEQVHHLRYRLGPGGQKAPRDEHGVRHCPGGCQGIAP